MLTPEEYTEYWKNLAVSDIETAEILIKKKKLREGLFFCHLTIEKILKAHYCKVNQKEAPKTHHLFYLFEKSEIEIDDDKRDFFGVLMKYNLEGRYPEYNPVLPQKEKIYQYLRRTRKELNWLLEIL